MLEIRLPNGAFAIDVILRWLQATVPKEIYQYSYLDPSVREIRLVTLLQGPETADIECLLSHVSLDQSPYYEALSYVWGEPIEEIRTIKLEGHLFPVTPNLEVALRHLRSETETRTLWVDAISINQVDEEEKSHQVQEMTSIYELASKVLIWLGPAEYDSDLAIELIGNIGAAGLEQFKADEANPKPWEALSDLFRRPWWSRAWVLQEATVNQKDPLVGCGQLWISWSSFDTTHRFIESQVALGSSGSRMVMQATKSQVSAIHNLRGKLRGDSSPARIERLLRMAMTFRSRDPRDQIFSLFGLAHEEDRHLLLPDYTKSVQEVYTDLAIYLLSHNINMLFVNTNSPCQNLPSWVPDWSWSTRRWCLWIDDTYKASGNTEPAGQFSSNPSTLSIPGIIVDYVAKTDELFPRGNDPLIPYRESLPTIVDSIESLVEKANQEQSPASSDSNSPSLITPDSLWRTLIANKTLADPTDLEPRYPAPLTYGTMFEIFRNRAEIPSTFRPDLPPARRKELFILPFELALHSSIEDQRFFTTRHHRIGIGPRELKENDLVVVFWGADIPAVLREEKGHQRILGAAYVHGIMDGEAFKGVSEENVKERSEVFVLR